MQISGLPIAFSTSQFIQSLGNFTTAESFLLKVPAGVATIIFTLMAGLIARRRQQTIYTGILMCMIV